MVVHLTLTIIERDYCNGAFVMGYYVNRGIWNPKLGEKLDVIIEPDNIKDKYAVAVHQKGNIALIGHLPLGRSSKFAKTNHFFLKFKFV